MVKYSAPEIEVVAIDTTDVILASGGTTSSTTPVTPEFPDDER